MYSRAAWSPDSKFLVVSVFGSLELPGHSQGELYKFNVDEPSYVQPIMLPSGESNSEIFNNPIFSPNGSKIAFQKMGPGVDGSEIWIVDEEGNSPEKLTSGNHDNTPAWSPDGLFIAFSRSIPLEDAEGFSTHIFIIDVVSKEVIQVTKNPGKNPIWIP